MYFQGQGLSVYHSYIHMKTNNVFFVILFWKIKYISGIKNIPDAQSLIFKKAEMTATL